MLEAGGLSCGKNCVPSLASLFICGSTALRQRALRPQLKRDPLGSGRNLESPEVSAYILIAGRSSLGPNVATVGSGLMDAWRVRLMPAACGRLAHTPFAFLGPGVFPGERGHCRAQAPATAAA